MTPTERQKLIEATKAEQTRTLKEIQTTFSAYSSAVKKLADVQRRLNELEKPTP